MWLTYSVRAYSIHFPGLGSAWYIITVTCRLFELHGQEQNIKILPKELMPLEGVGPQKCLAFSVDGSRFATGGVVSILNHQLVLYILHNCLYVRVFVHWTCLLMKGWASQNFRVAKYACNFRWTKGSQIISGYGFQVGIKFIHHMNSKNDTSSINLLLLDAPWRCSVLICVWSSTHFLMFFLLNQFKPMLVSIPLASLSFFPSPFGSYRSSGFCFFCQFIPYYWSSTTYLHF